MAPTGKRTISINRKNSKRPKTVSRPETSGSQLPYRNIHSLALKYRTKRIHFGIDGMEARTKLAVLTHNHNVGKELATEKLGTKRLKVAFSKALNRWTIKNVHEKMNIDYLEDISTSVLKIANGKISPTWCSRAPGLPPNLANVERPLKELIKRQQLR